MRVFAYCAAGFTTSVRRAAGVEPLTSPPATAEDFDPARLEGRDFLYFKLHGLAGEPYWYGDGWVTALTAGQVRRADLAGATVFVANCWLPESPMLGALLEAGAGAVVGGAGENYARPWTVDGADLLGMWLRRWLRLGLGPRRALRWAKARLHLGRLDRAKADALAFELYTREKLWHT